MSSKGKGRKHPQAKPKPKAAAKHSAKARPKRAPQVSRPRRYRPGNVTSDYPTDILQQIRGALAHKEKEKCVNPSASVEYLDYERSWGRIIDCIDAYIRLALITRPNLFLSTFDPATSGNPTIPTVRVTSLRVCWLLAIQEYWYSKGVIRSVQNDLSNFRVGDVKVPYGIMKVAQMYLPFVDTTTGVIYNRYVPSLGTPYVNYLYWSIDANAGTDTTATLNAVRTTPLIHAMNWKANSELKDYAMSSATITSLQNYSTALQTVYEYYGNMSTSERAQVSSLYAGVFPREVKEDAPDNSVSSIVTPAGVTNVAPMFSSFGSVLVGYFRNYGENLDATANYPYSKSLPTIMALKNANPVDFITEFRVVCYRLYAYMTSTSSDWSTGPVEALLRTTTCFRTATEYSFSGVQIDTCRVAYFASCLFQSLTGTGISGTALYSLINVFWSAMLQRVAPIDQMVDQTTAYACWAAGNNALNPQLPAVLARVVSGVGPIVLKGKPYFPYWGTSPLSWAGMINGSNGNYTFTSSVANVLPTFWQSFWTTGAGGSAIISYNGATLTFDNTVRYTILMSLLSSPVFFSMKTLSANSLNTGRLCPAAPTCLGRKSSIMSLLEYQTLYNTFLNTSISAQNYKQVWTMSVKSAVNMICFNYSDTADAMLYGVVALTPEMAGGNYIRATTVANLIDLINFPARTQSNIDGQANDAYSGIIEGTNAMHGTKGMFTKEAGGPVLVKLAPANNNVYSGRQESVVIQSNQLASALLEENGRPNYSIVKDMLVAASSSDKAKRHHHKSWINKAVDTAAHTATHFVTEVGQGLLGSPYQMGQQVANLAGMVNTGNALKFAIGVALPALL